MARARKPIASDSPSATTPRTTGRRSAQCRVIGETIGCETCAMSPSGLRTSTDQCEGQRIITPSKTAWPPISEHMLSVKTTWRPAPARGGAGTAPPGHPCRRASAYPCRKGGSSSRSRRAALASSSGSGTRFRTRSARSRARIRDVYRASSAGQDSSGDPADEPAASGGNDDHARVRRVFLELERNRPVPGDHGRIVESVDERAAGLGDEVAEALERGQRVGRLEVDRAAIGPRRLDLLL